MFYIYLGTKNPKNSHPNLFFLQKESIASFAKVNSGRSTLKAEIILCPCIPLPFQTEKDGSHISMTHAFSSTFFGFSLWLPENFGLFYCFSRLYVHFLSSIYSSFRISLWLPENFGLFPAFSVLYVHSHRLCSVLPSGFRMFLDFFPAFLGLMSIFTCSVQCFSLVSRSFWTFFLAFLCFMSIFTCPAPYFPLVSGCFWTFLLLFSTLYTFSPAQLHISLWLPDDFGLFYCFFSALCPFSSARLRISL